MEEISTISGSGFVPPKDTDIIFFIVNSDPFREILVMNGDFVGLGELIGELGRYGIKAVIIGPARFSEFLKESGRDVVVCEVMDDRTFSKVVAMAEEFINHFQIDLRNREAVVTTLNDRILVPFNTAF